MEIKTKKKSLFLLFVIIFKHMKSYVFDCIVDFFSSELLIFKKNGCRVITTITVVIMMIII
jgi:hypothetical protein